MRGQMVSITMCFLVLQLSLVLTECNPPCHYFLCCTEDNWRMFLFSWLLSVCFGYSLTPLGVWAIPHTASRWMKGTRSADKTHPCFNFLFFFFFKSVSAMEMRGSVPSQVLEERDLLPCWAGKAFVMWLRISPFVACGGREGNSTEIWWRVGVWKEGSGQVLSVKRLPRECDASARITCHTVGASCG